MERWVSASPPAGGRGGWRVEEGGGPGPHDGCSSSTEDGEVNRYYYSNINNNNDWKVAILLTSF